MGNDKDNLYTLVVELRPCQKNGIRGETIAVTFRSNTQYKLMRDFYDIKF